MPLDGSLPPGLVADFVSTNTWAESFYLAGTGDGFVWVSATYTNDGPDASVRLRWMARVPLGGAFLYDGIETTHEVSYRPTAVCRAGGVTDTFYVLGWAERPEEVVLEEWSFESGALAVAYGPTGDPSFSFVAPPLRREMLRTFPGLLPIEDAVFHPVSRELVMLEYGPAANVWTVGVDDDAAPLVPLLDWTHHEDLLVASDLRFLLHDAKGYVLSFLGPTAWSGAPAASSLSVLDSDLDGVFEPSTLMRLEGGEASAVFPPDGWIEDYEDSP